VGRGSLTREEHVGVEDTQGDLCGILLGLAHAGDDQTCTRGPAILDYFYLLSFGMEFGK